MNNRMQNALRDSKPKNTRKVIKRLWDYLYKFKWLLLIALVLTLLSNLFSLIGPKLSGSIVDQIERLIEGEENNAVINKILDYATLMLMFYIVSSIFSFVLSRLMLKISKKVVYKMREDAFKKITELPVSYFDTNQTGDIISKMSYDISTINTSLSSDLIQIITSVITVVGSLIMMLTISPILSLIFVITIPISLMFTRFMIKKTRKLFRERSKTLGSLNGYVEEMISASKTIKAYGKEEEMLNRFDNFNKKATTSAYRAEYYGSITGPGVNFVNNLSLTLICIFGAFLSIYKGFSLGKISSFILYSRKFSGPINEVANIFTDLQSALAASERVFALIDAKAEDKDKINAIELENMEGFVECKNVKFGYSNDKTIIHNLSFKADKGKIIAIVGPTGSGKTTIVNLLMRFYDVNSGEIFVDQHNILDIKRKSLRESYAMVLQDTWLFQGTVFENVSYGKKDATLDEVINACKAARIHHFIERLPQGYNTILNEGGVNISKGQKQLLTIARAMLLDAKMLILDEATSNVDTRTEIKIQEAMKNLMKNKTCFIIAHRLSTIQNADLILVIKDGDILEKGKHQDLIDSSGFYKELYYSQFE